MKKILSVMVAVATLPAFAPGGEVVRATIVSANAAADVSLLQLERVTKAMRVARMVTPTRCGSASRSWSSAPPMGSPIR